MFSAFVQAQYGHPDVAVSFLEPSTEFIHSCHFVIRAMSVGWGTFAMLLTYTQRGVRLSCTKFEGITLLDTDHLVETHLQVGHFT